jgi:hypothetical protein
VLGVVRRPLTPGASSSVVERAVAAADGRAILAEPASAEAIAAAGGRIWISNPLDAFPRSDQRAYLAWLEGKAPARQPLVLVETGTASTASWPPTCGSPSSSATAARGSTYVVTSEGAGTGPRSARSCSATFARRRSRNGRSTKR